MVSAALTFTLRYCAQATRLNDEVGQEACGYLFVPLHYCYGTILPVLLISGFPFPRVREISTRKFFPA